MTGCCRGIALAPLLLGTLLIAGASAAPPSSAEPPRSLGELERQLRGRSDAGRRLLLVRFAGDQRAPLPQRLRAVDRALRLDPAGSSKLEKDRWLKARLLAVAGRWPARARVLGQLARDDRAQGRSERAERLAALIAAERAAPALQRRVERLLRGTARAATASELRAVDTARPLPVLAEELGLPTEQTLVGCWLALLDEDRGDAPELVAALEVCAQRSEGQRDLAALRQASLRALARRAEKAGDPAAALRWSLLADRVVVIALPRPAFDLPPPPPFARSEASARLCHRARQQGTPCAQVERGLDGQLSFFDFSRGPVLAELDADSAAAVLSNHEVLLQDCLQEGARSGELVGTRVELEWSIGHDGRVAHHELRPARLRQGAFPGCLDQAFARFRYPRYRGEMQHVSLGFEVGD